MLERQTFVGMTDRMTKIQGFPDTFLFWVLCHDILFNGYRLCYELIQIGIIHRIDIIQHDGQIDIHRTDQCMLDHLGITGKNIGTIQCTKEFTVDKDTQRRIERTDLILQSVEVNSRLTANSSIDRRQASTDAIKVVGTLIVRMPRLKVAPAKPPISVTIPPPRFNNTE